MRQREDGEAFLAEEELRQRALEGLTIMDDLFMRNVLEDERCTEFILRVILEKKELKLVEQKIQKDYKNMQGRSAIMDCVARDSRGRLYDIEIQGDREGASPKRARYYSGLLDMHSLKAGEDFQKLRESYVIFITRSDVLGHELPIYHIGRIIRERGAEFGDGTHIIYVNSKIQDDTELGKLMHDLHCKKASEMHSEVLARRVCELKETEKGVRRMCRELEELMVTAEERGMQKGRQEGIREGRQEGIREGKQEGRQEGVAETKREMARSLRDEGMPTERIARIMKEKLERIREWLEEAPAAPAGN